MIDHKYSYIILGALFLILWLILFSLRKDVRREMWATSLLFGVVALILEPVIYNDWWVPLTITGTIPCIESFLFGFACGGIAAVIYEEISRKKLKPIKKEIEKNNSKLWAITILGFISFFSMFCILKIDSFLSSSISMIILITIIYTKRPDLIKNSIVSGIATLISAFIIYSIMQIITPGWIESFWIFKNTPKIIFLNVPIDDIIWFLLFGALWGPLYEYIKNKKLVNK
jgi:hypothetical protein